MLARFGIALAIVSSVGTACTDQASFTNLNPDGPPALAEVRLKETYMDTTGSTLPRRVFGFGTFPDATSDLDHPVTSAAPTGQSLRIIMDELLVGNSLEEIQCRGQVDNDAFSSVPLGATPDDIALCAVNTDALKASCHGDHAVCICQLDMGCPSGTTTVPKGEPVGVLDNNNDGAADNTSFKAGAVGIKCGSIDVPIDLDQSYWNPSGDQQVPAMGGYDALGPAIVLVPTGGFLPTNLKCGLTFADDVVDKQNNRVCAPPAGRPASCTGAIDDCSKDLECTPGDVSAFQFTSEALKLTVLAIVNGATGVNGANPIFINANAPVDLNSIQTITLSPAPLAGTFDITLATASKIKINFTTPLTPATMYTLTIPTTVTDTFGQALPAPITITFTTA
jgi:hypothetical protein